MKKLLKLLTISSLAGSLMSPFAVAESLSGVQAEGHDGGFGFHKLMERMVDEGIRSHESYGDVILRHAEELQLSDEQIGKIYRIHQANQQRIMGISKKLRDATEWAHGIFLDPSKDEASIRQTAKAHNAAFDELLDTALKTRKDINAILTADQLAKLPTLNPSVK
jgi:Spy/CpxP family protein refolding chaperone